VFIELRLISDLTFENQATGWSSNIRFCTFGAFELVRGWLIFVGRFFVLHIWSRDRARRIVCRVKLGKLRFEPRTESLRPDDMNVYIP
jgi:hypothetical protein